MIRHPAKNETHCESQVLLRDNSETQEILKHTLNIFTVFVGTLPDQVLVQEDLIVYDE